MSLACHLVLPLVHLIAGWENECKEWGGEEGKNEEEGKEGKIVDKSLPARVSHCILSEEMSLACFYRD